MIQVLISIHTYIQYCLYVQNEYTGIIFHLAANLLLNENITMAAKQNAKSSKLIQSITVLICGCTVHLEE